jgi:O-acetylhomoserine/O-acetylserine sulfhydrylase-like pyridoxal-dependent enzyme
MTFDDLEHCIHEDIIIENDDRAAIAAEVSKLLNGLKQEHIFLVHRLAKDFAAAIAFEFAFKDGDMVEIVRKQGAVLEPMVAWLQHQGVNSNSLRPAARMKSSTSL